MADAYSCDVLVVGAGPAGLAAAALAAESGAKVILADDNLAPGGQIWRQSSTAAPAHTPKQAAAWKQRAQASGAQWLSSTRVAALIAPHRLLAERSESPIAIHFQSLVLATGARELLLPFPGWTLPNVTGAGGLQALVQSGLPIAGKRVVVAGTGPLLLAVASFLRSAGAQIQGVFEQSLWSSIGRFGASLLARPATLAQGLQYRLKAGISGYQCGWWPVAAQGCGKCETVTVTNGSARRTIACDYLACGFHLVPNTELAHALGCRIAFHGVIVNEFQQTSQPGIFTAGETTGIGGMDLALLEGRIAGLAAAGRQSEAEPLLAARDRLAAFAARMNAAFALRPELQAIVQPDTIVCRCEDVPWSAIAAHPNFRSAKIHTRCGMGACQGRVCGAALHFLRGWNTASARPPVFPVRVSSLCGGPATHSQEELCNGRA